MGRYAASALLDFARAVVRGLGAPEKTADAVASSLVQADVRGVATHGVVRLPSYRAQVDAGEIDPAAQPRVVREGGATLVVDGALAFGALTAGFAMDEAIGRARSLGVAVAAAHRCTHFGTAAHHALLAAHEGLIGIAATSTPGVMAPFGGASAVLGNNPFAVAAPMPAGQEPFVLDMAQTVVARGRVKLAEVEGEAIPEGWAVDPEGRSTTDPALALAGALLPSGGYKGSGLALAIEALTAVLAGADLGPELLNTSMTGAPAGRPGARVGSVGQMFLAIDPDAFVGRAAYEAALARLLDTIRATAPAPGAAEVLVPGDLEARAAAAAARDGVPVADSTVAALSALGAEFGAGFPAAS